MAGFLIFLFKILSDQKFFPIFAAEQKKDKIMARKTLVQTVSEKENVSIQEAYNMVEMAKEEMHELLEQGDMEEAYNICETWFGLEPDYLEDILL